MVDSIFGFHSQGPSESFLVQTIRLLFYVYLDYWLSRLLVFQLFQDILDVKFNFKV
jgi:hypothetical protein